MAFFANGSSGFMLTESVLLDADEAPQLQAGTRFKVIYDKDHSEVAEVDSLGYLMTGDGTRLDDLVANITVGGERFGIRYLGPGPLGQRWAIVGGIYDEKLAPLETGTTPG